MIKINVLCHRPATDGTFEGMIEAVLQEDRSCMTLYDQEVPDDYKPEHVEALTQELGPGWGATNWWRGEK